MFLRPRTLLWRLGLVLMAAQVLVAVVLGLYGYRRIRDFHFDQTQDELRRLTPVLVNRYAAPLIAGDAAALDRLAKEDGAGSGVRITVVRADGRVLGESQADPAAMDDHRTRPEIIEALRTGTGTQTRFSQTVNRSMVYFARRIDGPDGAAGVVRVSLPLREVETDLARVTRVFALAGAASIGLTLLIIYLVSRRLSGQVRAVAEGAARFAAGDLDYRLAHSSSRELAALSRSLNDMAGQISRSIRELKVRQFELQAILQAMSNGVLAIDLEQRILNMNRAAEEMLGIDARAFSGRLLHEAVREPALHRFVTEALQAPAGARRRIELAGSGPRAVEVVAETLVDARGERGGLLLLLIDRTEERRFESLRSDFAANVSHELRTPITNIRGYVETLEEVGWEDREQASKFLGIIRANSQRLAAIVEDVMSLSKLEHLDVREILAHERSGLDQVVGIVQETFGDAARAKGMTLRAEIQEGLSITVHGPLMEQAIGNLVSNAIAYGPADSTVTIGARRERGSVVIEVRDEGPGIAAEHLPRLFERFYRVDKARSREAGGTGLGLALVKHIAQAHGGRVEVESVVGRGSTFRIILPDAGGS